MNKQQTASKRPSYLCFRLNPRHVWLATVLMILSTDVLAQRLQPVKWTFEATQIGKNEAVLTLTAAMEDGWHLYSQFMDNGGPLPTNFTFKAGNFELMGNVKEESVATRSYDNTFMMNVVWFSKAAIFLQRVRLKAPVVAIEGSVVFMACSGEICLQPEEVDFKLIVNSEDREAGNRIKVR